MNNEETSEITVEEESKFRLRTIETDQDISDLRKRSEDVVFAIADNSGSACLDRDTQDLIEALKSFVIENDGLGMAAVQLGVHKRILVMRRPFSSDQLLVAINPSIKRGYGNATKRESCFSIPNAPADGMVKRMSHIHIEYSDEKGIVHQDELFGMDARVFQHELDHLDGILYIDTKPLGWGFQGWRTQY